MNNNRIHYMDNLRAFAMLLGIFFHAALAYSPLLNQLWFTADPNNHIIIDLLSWFSHCFRMPLFFIIAGFFACLLYQKRGIKKLLVNRLIRIVLPLFIFLPIVLITTLTIFTWAGDYVQDKPRMLSFVLSLAENPDSEFNQASTMHLWFLYLLTWLYPLAIIAAKWLKVDMSKLLLSSPRGFIALFPLLLVPALLSQHAPIPAPDKFMPQLWALVFYGLLFLLGWQIFRTQDFLDKLKAYVKPMLVFSVIFYAIFFSLLPKSIGLGEALTSISTMPEMSLEHVLMSISEAYLAVYMSLVLIIFGKEKLNQHNKTIRLIADSSYWLYLLHLPLLFYIQYCLLGIDLPLLVKFLISSASVIAIGLVTYLLFIRWTPVGWMLNGRR